MLEALRPVLPANEFAALAAWTTTFYPFQQEWLFDQSEFAIANKSRQIGISHTTAAAAVVWGALLGETTTIVSVGEREAIEVIDHAKKHASVLRELGSTWAQCSETRLDLRFRHSGRIVALPATSGGRGYSGNVFLDEYAYQDHAEAVWDAAAAVTMHGGGKMRIASTPNGVGNAFHNLWDNPQANEGYRKHLFPIARAIADGMNVDIAKCKKMAKGDPRLWAQFFECSFLDGDEQYISTEYVTRARSAVERKWIDGTCYAGIDIGLSNDLFVIVVVSQDDTGHVFVEDVIVGKRSDWDEQLRLIAKMIADYQPKRICIDETGIGWGPTQHLKKLYGEQRVEGVVFTMQSKERLATDLYHALAEQMLTTPRNDIALERDVCAIRRIITQAGNVRYDAQRTSEGHADRAWALALGIHACSLPARSVIESGPGLMGSQN